MTPEVTVAVPVKDRREQMLRCLDALLVQDHPSFEILVLDNESSDGTGAACVERARGSAVPVRVERVPGTLGAVRNQAAHLVGSELLAFTDSDCLPTPDWLSVGTNALREDERLGVVQGRTLPEVEPDRGWAATIRVEEFTSRYEACNLIFRRAALAGSDGFDEEVGHFWEDTAAGFAIRRAGWQARYVPEALVHHDVTYPGFWWHIERVMRNANIGPVVRRYPEIRREVLFGRVFLARRDAQFLAALVGLALSRRERAALLLTLPYVAFHATRPEPWIMPRVKGHGQEVVFDIARLIAMLKASARGRTLLL